MMWSREVYNYGKTFNYYKKSFFSILASASMRILVALVSAFYIYSGGSSLIMEARH